MIAIVILGIGLIMVAAMFPIAWNRARNLAEFTTQQTLTATAEELCKLLLRVDGEQRDVGGFAGDLSEHTTFGGGDFVACRDTRVHLLHMQNVSASTYEYVPAPARSGNRDKPVAPPWRIEGMSQNTGSFNLNPQLDLNWPNDAFFTHGFGAPQIRFEQRVYPPMQPYDSKKLEDNTGQPDPNAPDINWENNLDARRYAFAVFHKLNTPLDPAICNPAPPADEIEEGLEEEREFTMYYATLRRTRPTLRFAVQDPSKVPDPQDPARPVEVEPLPSDDDVLFPEPWRVQVYFQPAEDETKPVGFEIWGSDDPAILGLKYEEGSGLPTVAQINHPDYPTGPLTIDFFERGTVMIDERNGQLYEVTEVRRVGSGQQELGLLTLDREIVVKDLDDSPFNGSNGFLDQDEALRTVWVFPPPIERDGQSYAFTGGSPVVGIDIGSLFVAPGD
ncbi:MAG: hypothetical protein J5J06_19275 [Phycisphaerae bacterium]|nr:hypothetical protein [Phycisphaerae bacterium]